ncbi:MAG: AEC family transporter [Candidatus Omnitrophota bacterium]
MFLESFKTTGIAVGQIFILGAIGYILARRKFLGEEGLQALARLVMDVTLPVMIFCQLIRDFRFALYPEWWVFPLLSFAITALALGVGVLFTPAFKDRQHKLQFLNLVGFQNSGYLPLALVAALLPADKIGTMFIYLFLFLLGFNMAMFSLGVHMLAFRKDKKFRASSLLSPPVVAIIITLIIIFFGLGKFIPSVILKPLGIFGDCTLPLAMLVVGGNLAELKPAHIDKKAIFLMALAKLVILPLLGIALLAKFKVPQLLGLLIIMQLSMPPATTLSIIVRNYKKEDFLISQGIFFGHIVSVITIPVFLSLYFALGMLK